MKEKQTFDTILEERKNTSIYHKLSKVKAEIGVLSKNAKNPFFKSDYLDLNGILSAVEPLFEKYGLLLLQPIEFNKVITRIVDVDVADSDVVSMIELPTITDPQKLGSAITYFRRYTLQSLLALQAVDDDGNVASKAKKVLKQEDFQRGLDKMGAEAFKKFCKDYELTEVQTKSLQLL